MIGRAQYRHCLRVPAEEHVLLMAPPRTRKTALLTKIILHYPALARSVLPAGGSSEDVGAFLASSGTLYLIAESEHDDSPVAPLLAAMVGEVHHVAAQAGQPCQAGDWTRRC